MSSVTLENLDLDLEQVYNLTLEDGGATDVNILAKTLGFKSKSGLLNALAQHMATRQRLGENPQFPVLGFNNPSLNHRSRNNSSLVRPSQTSSLKVPAKKLESLGLSNVSQFTVSLGDNNSLVLTPSMYFSVTEDI